MAGDNREAGKQERGQREQQPQQQRTKTIYTDEYRVFLRRYVAARRKSGVTQEELARRTGTNQAYISRLERGYQRIDVMELRMLLRAFGVDMIDFLQEVEAELGSVEKNAVDEGISQP